MTQVRDIIYTANSITLNPTLWLKSDKGIHLSGSSIYQWDDQSGNGYNAIQLTADNQPLLVNNTINGKPGILFDGVNDFLQTNSFSAINVPHTIFIVADVTLNDKTSILSYNDFTGSGCYAQGVPNIYFQESFDDSTVINTSNISVATFNMYSIVNSLLITKIFINSVLSNSGVLGLNHSAITKLSIGKLTGYTAYKSNLNIAEIIIYNSTLADSDRTVIEHYLNKKYNLY